MATKPKPVVLIFATVWQIGLLLQYRRQTFYQREFAESASKWLTSTTTSNSDMATKTGNTYTTGTTTDSFKIQTQVRYFWRWRVQIKCPQVIIAISDNRKWRPPEPEVLISLELWQIGWQFQRNCVVFGHAKFEETEPEPFPQGPTTGNDNIDVLGPSPQFSVAIRCQNHLATL